MGKLLMGERDGAVVVCLNGPLGSGKTTFAQGFAKALGVKTRLLSPTFIIVRRYDISHHSFFLYHIDLYRIGKSAQTEQLGLGEIFADPRAVVVIEWAEYLGNKLPRKRTEVTFRALDDTTRVIETKTYGE
jgi:tRNA threonylcarbamoyladenosine biosynthesis protein TsaE